jgi:hypothetical protein
LPFREVAILRFLQERCALSSQRVCCIEHSNKLYFGTDIQWICKNRGVARKSNSFRVAGSLGNGSPSRRPFLLYMVSEEIKRRLNDSPKSWTGTTTPPLNWITTWELRKETAANSVRYWRASHDIRNRWKTVHEAKNDPCKVFLQQ